MENRMPSHSGLFLLELIISILFFSLAGTVCIQLFVKAHLLDRKNEQLNEAVRICVSFSEIYTSYAGNELQLTELYPNAAVTEDLFLQYYSDDWNECPQEYAVYELRVSFKKETVETGIMHCADICITPVAASTTTDITEASYQLDVDIYRSFRG